MSAAPWHLVKAFLREATEDEHFEPVADLETAYVKLRSLQRGHFETTVEEGKVLVSSTVGAKQFAFHVPSDLSPGDIMAIAEEALELLVEAGSITAARIILRRRKTTRGDFTRLQH